MKRFSGGADISPSPLIATEAYESTSIFKKGRNRGHLGPEACRGGGVLRTVTYTVGYSITVFRGTERG